MLKIKDNVDLKKLEKYKVEKFGKFDQLIGHCSEYGDMGIDIDLDNRRVALVTMDSYEDIDSFDDELLDWFYDLVKDGIVKKVKKD